MGAGCRPVNSSDAVQALTPARCNTAKTTWNDAACCCPADGHVRVYPRNDAVARTPSALRPPPSSVDAIADVTVASSLAPLDPSIALALSPDGEVLLVGLEGGKLAAHRLADSSGNGERE